MNDIIELFMSINRLAKNRSIFSICSIYQSPNSNSIIVSMDLMPIECHYMLEVSNIKTVDSDTHVEVYMNDSRIDRVLDLKLYEKSKADLDILKRELQLVKLVLL